MGVVRSDRWNPGTPQQGEEPRCIDGVEVHTQVPGCIVPGQRGRGWSAALLPELGKHPKQTVSFTVTQEDDVSVSMLIGQAQFCPVLPISCLNPVCSALCPHVLGGGLNRGIHRPSSSRGTWGDTGQAPELLVGHLSVAKVQFLDVTSP